jgi:phage baseplate assembly protein W
MGVEIYGVDMAFDEDYELLPAGDVEVVSGVHCVVQDIIHELSTPKGDLFYNSEYGVDIYKYINEDNTFINRLGLSQEVKKVLNHNQRIEPTTAKVEVVDWNLNKIKLKASFSLISVDNPLNLILTYSQNDIEVEAG